jgi:hypothetical protein
MSRRLDTSGTKRLRARSVDSWIAREEKNQLRIARCWLGDLAAETSSIEMCRETVHAEHRDEVASLNRPRRGTR